MDPDTPALRALAGSDLDFEIVRTQRARSAEESAALQGIELGQLLRTIVIRRGAGACSIRRAGTCPRPCGNAIGAASARGRIVRTVRSIE